MKRKLLFLMALLLPLVASAYDAYIDGIYYIFSGDKATVINKDFPIVNNISYDYSGIVVIPESVTYNGKTYTVTNIQSAFFGCVNLTSITIPNSMISIGYYSFYGCSGLTDVYCLSEDVPGTDDSAFENSSIASATLHVPASALDAYKAWEPWSEFGNIVPLGGEAVEHEYVDLGLPSGTLWATCNVGANSPDEYGNYFAWGETTPKSEYSWNTYNYCNGTEKTMTKYCPRSSYGYNSFTDDKTELEPEDDAATANWGSDWQLPSEAQQKELIEYCSLKWTTLNGVKCILATGPNGGKIYLPTAGLRNDMNLRFAGERAYFLSRSLNPSTPSKEYCLLFYTENSTNKFQINSGYRFLGQSVRPVRVKDTPPAKLVTSIELSETSLTLYPGETKTLTATVLPEDAVNKAVTWSSTNSEIATVDQTGRVTAKAKGTCAITCTAQDDSGVKAEDCQVRVIEDKPEDVHEKTLRIFMNTGEIVDFNTTEIDSITATSQSQLVWKDKVSQSFSIEEIDSIVYIFPSLKVSIQEMNFGKVAIGNKKSNSITITNTGKYPETFFLFTDGVFEAPNSGRYFSIDAGESLDMEVAFKPTEKTYYSSKLLLSSSAVDNGVLSLPMVGRGVGSISEEEDYVLPPEDTDMSIVLPDDQPIDGLDGFKIVNSYGEFPIQTPSKANGARRVEANYNAINSPIQKSLNGLQLHTMVDQWNNPWLFSISLPDQDIPEMSAEQTAISILMTDPLLITSNEAAYNNTVQAIKDLDDVYKDYLKEVTEIWEEGLRNKMCPDYSNVNIKPIILALYEKVKDNSNLTLDGLSLMDVVRDPETIRYKVRNDRRRIVHIYPKRAKKAEGSDVTYEKVENACSTLQEVCQFILNGGDLASDIVKDEEYKEFIEDLQEWVGELEESLVALGLGDANSHIQVPIILESKYANYWKLVKETFWDSWVKHFDMSTSIYEVSTDEIATTIEDCDQVLVDIYGVGNLDMDWSKLTGEEKFRIIFACLHSGYKDYVRPLMDLGSGFIDAVNATGSDEYKYDFRYGERAAPTMALLTKLSKEFASDPERVKELRNAYKYGDFYSALKLICSFVCDEILKCPSETDDKRTYTNLIYNIYKKITKNPATSKKFRDNFKAVANNLTHLKNANFAAKVIKTSEAALDVSSTIKAFLISKTKNTFVINKSTDAYITVTEPTELLRASSNNVHFAWTTYKADYFDHYLYDIDLYIITPEKAIEITAKKDIDGTECNLNLASVLSDYGAGNAISVEFRISGHADNNPNIIYARTEYMPLLKLFSPDDFVFVDMGLKSGVLWANRNLGAPTARDFGNYYAWGETTGYNEGKTTFNWKNYKYCRGTSNSLTKYCPKSDYGNSGFTDDLTRLQGFDDPASSTYGYYYAIPTKEEWEELMTSCRWSQLDGCAFIRGVYGKSNNIILLPPAGYRSGMNLYDAESEGYYWSSTLDQSSPDDAWMMHFSTGNSKPNEYDYYRCQGRSIRMVLRPRENTSGTHNIKRQSSPPSQEPMEMHSEGMTVKTVSHSANR